MKIVLLAAGKGTRLQTSKPKPLVEVKNRPMFHHIIDKIRNITGEIDIVMVIREENLSEFESEMKNLGNVKYVFQNEQLGTANALKCALEVIDDKDDLLIMYADTVLIRESSIAGMINTHISRNNALTFLSGITQQKYPYALVERENGKIKKLEERKIPDYDPPYEYYVGPLIIDSEIAKKEIENVKPHHETGEYYIPDLINIIAESGNKVDCFKSLDESEYLGINNSEDLKKAEYQLSMREIENLSIMEERKIIFGTGGWRARIGRGFTSMNVRKVIQGICTYMIEEGLSDKGIVIGYDNRFLSEDFSEMAAEVFAANNIKVFLSKNSIPTPLVTFTVLEKEAGGGIVFTASHNPPDYNGIKFETHEGYPAPIEVTERVQEIANNTSVKMIPWVNFTKAQDHDFIHMEDFRNAYLDYIEEKIDIDAIKKVNPRVCFDPMHGAGTSTLQMSLIGARCDLITLNSKRDPLFGGKSPAPSEESLSSLIQFMRENNFDLGIAVDGDADRIALVDELGNYIPANDVILLVYYYLHEIKGMKGGAVRNIATSHNLDILCEKLGEQCYEVPVGFKYIAGGVKDHDLLLGGESSGGVTVRGHIMEKDGIYTAMLILEMLVKTGKSLSQLMDEIFTLNGKRYLQAKDDFNLTPLLKVNMEEFMSKEPDYIGEYKVLKIDRMDGMKIYLENDVWVLLRPSGTEPLLRMVSEATDINLAQKILKIVEKQVFKY